MMMSCIILTNQNKTQQENKTKTQKTNYTNNYTNIHYDTHDCHEATQAWK